MVVTSQSKVRNVLKFMQNEDRNGYWLEWLDEIKKGESTFDSDYVISVLQSWYDDGSHDLKYQIRIKELKSI